MNDPYLHPTRNVLRNKLDIMDAEKLAEAENDIVYIKLIEVDTFSDKKTFDVQYLKDLHYYLFCDIYDWAGQFRTMNIRKQERVLDGMSVEYADYSALDKSLDKTFQDLHEIQWKRLSMAEKATAFARQFAAIWQIHPFREGNTRTITTFMLQYAARQDLDIDGSMLSKYSSYVRDSLVMASIGDYSEYDHLEKIVLDAMGENTSFNNEHADTYSHINEYDVTQYHYKQFNEQKRER